MENSKKAIIVEFGSLLLNYDRKDKNIFLRPNLDEFVSKLKEAKENGVKIILDNKFKVAQLKQEGYQKLFDDFFELKPEYKEIFDMKRTMIEIEPEINDCESILYMGSKNPYSEPGYFTKRLEPSKLEYDEKLEKEGMLFFTTDSTGPVISTEPHYFCNNSNVEVNYGETPSNVIGWFEIAKKDKHLKNKLCDFIRHKKDRNLLGIEIMCSAVDDFLDGKYISENRVTIGKYKKEYQMYIDELYKKADELRAECWSDDNFNDYMDFVEVLESDDNKIMQKPVNELSAEELDEYLKSNYSFIFDEIKSKDKTPLQQKENELSKLEAEERKISEAEALIDKQNQKEGQDIGEE